MTHNTISPGDLVDRRVYRIISRNLIAGVWCAREQGFIGIREKFGTEYLFIEYEHDLAGPPYGTAQAVRDLGLDIPPGTPLDEYGPKATDEDGVEHLTINQSLFGALQLVEAGIYEEMRKEERERARLRAEEEARKTPEQRMAEKLEHYRATAAQFKEMGRQVPRGLLDKIREVEESDA